MRMKHEIPMYYSVLSLILIAELANSLRNVAVLEGNSIELGCHHDGNDVEWYFRGVGQLAKYDRQLETNVNPTRVNRTKNALILQSVTMSDAGTYMCHVISARDGVQTRIFYLQLIVIGSVECFIGAEQSKDFNLLQSTTTAVRCVTLFRGNWSPIIEWSIRNQYNVTRIINASVKESHNNGSTQSRITSDFELDGDRTLHGSSLVCEFRFGQIPVGFLSNATNIPACFDVWISPPIQVFYCSPNVSIFPFQHEYYPGDNLTCNVNAKPNPIYTWKNLQTGTISHGPHVVLELPTDHTVVYVCTVLYVAGEFNRSRTFEKAIIVTNKKSKVSESHTLTMTLIIVSVVMSLLALIMFLGCIHRWRINEETKKSSVLDVYSDRYEEIDSKTETDNSKMKKLSGEPHYENAEMFPTPENEFTSRINQANHDMNVSHTVPMDQHGQSSQHSDTVHDVSNYEAIIEKDEAPRKTVVYSKLKMNRTSPGTVQVNV